MLKTIVRVSGNRVIQKERESLADAVKRVARDEFNYVYPNEAIVGSGIIEIDTIKHEYAVMIVWG